MHSCGEIRQKSILGVFTSLAVMAKTVSKPYDVLSNTYLDLNISNWKWLEQFRTFQT